MAEDFFNEREKLIRDQLEQIKTGLSQLDGQKKQVEQQILTLNSQAQQCLGELNLIKIARSEGVVVQKKETKPIKTGKK